MHRLGGEGVGWGVGNKKDTLDLLQHPHLQSCLVSQKKTNANNSKIQPAMFSSLGFLAHFMGIPKHTAVLQHLCAYTTSVLLQVPSLHLLMRNQCI